jgi:hypothetical protein
LKRRKVLSPDFDAETEDERILNEIPGDPDIEGEDDTGGKKPTPTKKPAKLPGKAA